MSKPPILRFDMRRRFTPGTPLADAGLRGERKISCFANDTYHSLDGLFSVISRNIFVEHKVQTRFYPTNPAYDPDYVELWANKIMVGRVRSLTVAINWILLKVKQHKKEPK